MRTLFGCEVAFAASANEMHFEPAGWNAAPPQANERSRRYFENQCRHLCASMEAQFRYTDMVRGRLRAATSALVEKYRIIFAIRRSQSGRRRRTMGGRNREPRAR